MKITPVLTEKSMALAKNGKYTFKVAEDLRKPMIKKLVAAAYDVKVTTIKTMRYRARVKSTMTRRSQTIKGYKKAIVTLADKQTISVFGGEKK